MHDKYQLWHTPYQNWITGFSQSTVLIRIQTPGLLMINCRSNIHHLPCSVTVLSIMDILDWMLFFSYIAIQMANLNNVHKSMILTLASDDPRTTGHGLNDEPFSLILEPPCLMQSGKRERNSWTTTIRSNPCEGRNE